MTSAHAAAEAVIDGYRALLASSERLLALVRGDDWEPLSTHEADYLQWFERVAALDETHALTDDARRRKAELIERILDNDREIRHRLAERRDELGELIDSTRRQRDLQRAYGAGGGRVMPGAGRGQGAT